MLLIALLVFIALAGLIFWQKVYIVIYAPVEPLPFLSLNRGLFEETRIDFLRRAGNFEDLETSTYSNPFIR